MDTRSKTTSTHPNLLAIDTSTELVGIALATSESVHTRSWRAHRTQTTTLLPEIDALVTRAGITPADLDGLIVAIGPGTFTGLRVGLSVAKGIAMLRDLPIVGIPTLATVFASHPDKRVVAVLPAGRGRVVWQTSDSEPRNTTFPELLESLDGAADISVIGELSEEQVQALLDSGITVASEPRDPGVLLELGRIRIAAGDTDDLTTLEPTYLHGVAVTNRPIQDRLRKR